MVKLKELLKKGVRREIKARRIFQSMGIYEHQLRPVPMWIVHRSGGRASSEASSLSWTPRPRDADIRGGSDMRVRRMSHGAEKFVSEKIAKLRSEGYSTKQAVAIAFKKARARGFKIRGYVT